MKDFELKVLIDNDFDTVNRIINKFSGKGFTLRNLEVKESSKKNSCELNVKVLADFKVLEIIVKKLRNYIDVQEILVFSEYKTAVA